MRTVAVCLFSGGIDSAVAAQISKNAGDDVRLLSVNYGQVMQRELGSARAVASFIEPREHRFVEIHGFRDISKSGRTHDQLVERDRAGRLGDGTVPSAYPPGRDFTFISMAAAWAETVVLSAIGEYDSAKIVIGTNLTDTLDYPDTQASVYERFSELLRHSLKMAVVDGKDIQISTPLIRFSKQEVVSLGIELGVPLDLTWSCYSGGDIACGTCDACRIRYHAFEKAGGRDLIGYASVPRPLEVAQNAMV